MGCAKSRQLGLAEQDAISQQARSSSSDAGIGTQDRMRITSRKMAAHESAALESEDSSQFQRDRGRSQSHSRNDRITSPGRDRNDGPEEDKYDSGHDKGVRRTPPPLEDVHVASQFDDDISSTATPTTPPSASESSDDDGSVSNRSRASSYSSGGSHRNSRNGSRSGTRHGSRHGSRTRGRTRSRSRSQAHANEGGSARYGTGVSSDEGGETPPAKHGWDRGEGGRTGERKRDPQLHVGTDARGNTDSETEKEVVSAVRELRKSSGALEMLHDEEWELHQRKGEDLRRQHERERELQAQQLAAAEAAAVRTLPRPQRRESEAERCARQILEQVYHETRGGSWHFDKKGTNWCMRNVPLVQWEGIDRAKPGEYSLARGLQNGWIVALDEFGLDGELPSKLGDWQELVYFEAASNHLRGHLPETLERLSELRTLVLTNNRISGTIPRGIGQISKLTHLMLGRNKLRGTIPAELGKLRSLTHLCLDNNRLSGPIPPELGNLTNLELVALDENDLEGEIPSALLDANYVDFSCAGNPKLRLPGQMDAL